MNIKIDQEVLVNIIKGVIADKCISTGPGSPLEELAESIAQALDDYCFYISKTESKS